MNQTLRNIRQVYAKPVSWLVTLVAAALLGWLLYAFTDYELMFGNFGTVFASVQVGVQVLIAMAFGVNAAVLAYKIKESAGMSKRAYGASATGSFLSILVGGCAACGISLASYLGLAGVVSALPFFGLELKLAGLGLLLYSTAALAKNVGVCAISPR